MKAETEPGNEHTSSLQEKLNRTEYFHNKAREEIISLLKLTKDGVITEEEFIERLTHRLAKADEVSLFDKLTNIGNRHFFEMEYGEALERANASEDSRTFSLVLADIDHFKKFNDKYSLVVGDKVLRDVASTINMCVRTEYEDQSERHLKSDRNLDSLAIVDSQRKRPSGMDDKFSQRSHRWGGEEFALILAGVDDNEVLMTIMERIRETIDNKEFEIDGKKLNITVSLGGAVYQKGEEPDEFYKAVNREMSQSKAEGRNCSNVREL